VVVGDAKQILLPDRKRSRSSAGRLSGIRYIHTHLRPEPLSEEDLADLALLRFDCVAAIEVGHEGLPESVHVALLAPGNLPEDPWDVWKPLSPVDAAAIDFGALIRDLEKELARTTPLSADTETGAENQGAILVGVALGDLTEAEESLEELKSLADSCGVPVLDTILQRRPSIHPQFVVGKGKLIENYGMSETSPLIASNPSKGTKKLGSIGMPILNTDVKLVDPQTGKEAEPGQPGEICVKGPQVMVGYYKKPEETKNAIDNDGYMHTGDVAIMDDEGYLRIVDRTKDMIIVSGFKVFSVKVEDVLTRHPAIDMIATIGVPNPERPGSEIVKAFIQLVPEYAGHDRGKLENDILTFAKEKLTPYEVPKVIEFMDALPLTAVGKLDKKIYQKQQSQLLV